MADEISIAAVLRRRGNPELITSVSGDVVHRDRIDPSRAKDRKQYADAVCRMFPDIDHSEIAQYLLDACRELEEEQTAKRNGEPSIDTTGADEVDVSKIVRPEMILRPGLSAVAIPRILETPEALAPEWLHYIQDEKGRRCVPLEHRLRLPDGTVLHLHPMPCDPTAVEVNELGRWSKASRDQWLEGQPTPTTLEVLRMVVERIDRYVTLPPDGVVGHRVTLALWVMMTYLVRSLPAVPYVYLSGPAGSGKSRTMDVLSRLVFRPMMASSMTGPTLFRGRHANGGTILLDEAERMREDSPDIAELRSMLLAGYRAGGRSSRLEAFGDTWKQVYFDVYGPVGLGSIKGMPPALASRCIRVRMIRAGKNDPRTKRSLDDSPSEQRQTIDALHCWAIGRGFQIASRSIDDFGLSNRDLELWGPLIRIAVDTGDEELIRLLVEHASQVIEASADDVSPEDDAALVTALFRLRSEGKFPKASEVLERARVIKPDLWSEWSAKGVGTTLSNYGCHTTKTARARVFKTDRATIADVADRYGFDIEEHDD